MRKLWRRSRGEERVVFKRRWKAFKRKRRKEEANNKKYVPGDFGKKKPTLMALKCDTGGILRDRKVMYGEIKGYLDKRWKGINDPDVLRIEREREATAIEKAKEFGERWEEKNGRAPDGTWWEVAAPLAKQEKETQDDSGLTAGMIKRLCGDDQRALLEVISDRCQIFGEGWRCQPSGSGTRPRRSRRRRPTHHARTS